VLSSRTHDRAYLVRLRLAADSLHIEDCRDVGMAVQVMAAADPGELDSERLNQSGEVGEAHIGDFAFPQSLEQPSRIHMTNVGHGCDTHGPPQAPRGGKIEPVVFA